MRQIVCVVAVLLATVSTASAQDTCTPVAAGTVFTVTSGKAPTVSWLMAATVPTSATDPTPVPQRINGFTVQINTATPVDVNPAAMTPCPSGTTNAGKVPYMLTLQSGVPKGNHTLTVKAWNFVLDASGNPTTQRQESAAVSIPFVAGDLLQYGPPQTPTNGIISR